MYGLKVDPKPDPTFLWNSDWAKVFGKTFFFAKRSTTHMRTQSTTIGHTFSGHFQLSDWHWSRCSFTILVLWRVLPFNGALVTSCLSEPVTAMRSCRKGVKHWSQYYKYAQLFYFVVRCRYLIPVNSDDFFCARLHLSWSTWWVHDHSRPSIRKTTTSFPFNVPAKMFSFRLFS